MDVQDFNQVFFASWLLVLFALDFNVSLNRVLQSFDLFDFLLEYSLVFVWVVCDLYFAPFLADPALS